jgi:anthranilate synthase component II
MILMIDNYDSFTYNLVHYFGQLGQQVEVHRNDQISVDEVIAKRPKGVVLSPGPCDPDRAGICLELVQRISRSTPIFGVCLGHQTIGQVFGGKIVRAPKPMHGKVSAISHNGQGVFAGLPGRFLATRYHSLTIAPETVPSDLVVTARSEDGVIMGVQHASLPVHGVQFHPESIATERGHDLLKNFLRIAGVA